MFSIQFQDKMKREGKKRAEDGGQRTEMKRRIHFRSTIRDPISSAFLGDLCGLAVNIFSKSRRREAASPYRGSWSLVFSFKIQHFTSPSW